MAFLFQRGRPEGLGMPSESRLRIIEPALAPTAISRKILSR